MATRAERERQQRSTEKHKNILAILLSREENKFCADCLAKGPRWASWNLGVLLCIRCSGLHRSLGVHISRVKSVNLDTWTREQMLRFCCRGNGWAKENYEAKLPQGFKRPQSDSKFPRSLEYFIRDKYEKKKYISPVEITLRSLSGLGLNDENNDSPKKGRSKDSKSRDVSIVSIPKPKGLQATSPGIPRPKSLPQLPQHNPESPVQMRAQAPTPTTDDLLGLSSPIPNTAPVSVTVDTAPSASSDLTEDLFGPLSSFNTSTIHGSVSSPDLLNGSATPATEESPAQEKVEDKRLSKDSILSLYSQGTNSSSQNSLLSSGNFNIPQQQQPNIGYQQQQPNIGYQQQQQAMQYNQQSYQNIQQNMQAMPPAYQQQQMMAMQQQMQMQQLAQQMSGVNMTGMGYAGHPQQPQQQQNPMQNNMGYGVGYGAQPQTAQQMYNPQQQQQMYGGMPNGNPARAQMGGYGPATGGLMPGIQTQQQGNPMSMWGAGPSGTNAAGINSGHTLSTQLWK